MEKCFNNNFRNKNGPNFFSFTNGTLLLTENNFGTGLLNSF
jgi:hypothetical protein